MVEFRERLLSQALPGLYEELGGLLAALGRSELVKELPALILRRHCGCGDDFCLSINLKGGHRLSTAEKRESEQRIAETVDLNATEGIISVDIDDHGRIGDIEILYRDDVDQQLTTIGLPRVVQSAVERRLPSH